MKNARNVLLSAKETLADFLFLIELISVHFKQEVGLDHQFVQSMNGRFFAQTSSLFLAVLQLGSSDSKLPLNQKTCNLFPNTHCSHNGQSALSQRQFQIFPAFISGSHSPPTDLHLQQ